MLEKNDYFNLTHFKHRDIWQEDDSLWFPLVTLDEYLKKYPFQIEIQIPLGVHLERPESISIGRGTVIQPGVFIEGPCVIGRNCALYHGAYLRGGVICGDHCVIGHSAEIKHSILLNHASAAHFTYVGDSIIGGFANLGAGVKCSNLRFDRYETTVLIHGKKIKTGLKKFGAIIGDKVQIGCNCVLNPGTVIGKNSVSFPLLNFGGTIPPYSRILGEKTIRVERLETASRVEYIETVKVRDLAGQYREF